MSKEKNQQNQQSSGNGCLLPVMFTVAVLLALALGGVGGAMLDVDTNRAVTIHPNIPAPAPETLNYVPSVQTFAEPLNDCPDPSLPYAGWEDGVGGVLPPCWTREQQNAYMRSH